MILSSELRIGNKAFVKTSVVSLHRISQSEVVVDFGDDAEYEIMTPDDISPIPLSPEVLKACGFKQIFGDYCTTYQRTQIEIEVVDGNYLARLRYDWSEEGQSLLLRELKYLHELQNIIFSITNSELNYQP